MYTRKEEVLQQSAKVMVKSGHEPTREALDSEITL